MDIRGITVAVGDWYATTLSITLPRNARHMAEVLVVTTPGDDAVKAVAAAVPNARVYETDAFTRPGKNGEKPRFNKGLALEESFDHFGRHGWLLIWDSDIVFPPTLPLDRLHPGCLYGARRRILPDPAQWSESLDWRACRMHHDGGPIGFFQAFAADDPAIRDVRPWYNVNSPHAGLGDAMFMSHWTRDRWKILPVDCLHLGEPDVNWWGCDPEGRDMMAAYVHMMGWTRAAAKADPKAVDRVGHLVAEHERIDVEGYELSEFMMPFERRAKNRR